MRVLHLLTRLIRGGAQENTLLTVQLADRNRYEVHLAAGPEGEWLERGRQAAAKFHLIPSLVNPISPRHDLQALGQIVGLLRRERFTVVHTHTSKAGMLGRLAARIAGAPVVVHTPHGTILHDIYFGPRRQRAIAWAKRGAARRTDALITMSDCERDHYVDWRIAPREKFRTIYSGQDYRRFDHLSAGREELRSALGVEKGQRMILFPARFVPEKGHEFFFAAIPAVLQEYREAVAFLAGDGPLAAEVEARATASPHRDRLRLLGYRSDVLDLMNAADLVASASLSEGLPRAIVEALLLGKPVVATDAGGTREVVLAGRTGVLVPCADAEALARGLLELLGDPQRAEELGRAGQAHVRPMFDAHLMVRRIEALYEECLARKFDLAGEGGF